MKKLFAMIAIVAMSFVAIAQTNQLVWDNGRLMYATPIETIDSLTYGEMEDVDAFHLLLPRTFIKVVYDTVYVYDTIYVRESGDLGNPEVETHEYVDLGLSVKWATCNVGANSPEEYGDYFAWGETQPKENYNWSTYKYCNGSSDRMTKYCTKSSYGNDGFTDNKTVLDSEDDVATVNWGGNWRIPTEEEIIELRIKCTWTWTIQNNVKGYKVVGANGNSIFLPATGFMDGTSLYFAGSYGYYWSSLSSVLYPYNAYHMYFASNFVGEDSYKRNNGLSVRPVCE